MDLPGPGFQIWGPFKIFLTILFINNKLLKYYFIIKKFI
jgi:hypothetical protein